MKEHIIIMYVCVCVCVEALEGGIKGDFNYTNPPGQIMKSLKKTKLIQQLLYSVHTTELYDKTD